MAFVAGVISQVSVGSTKASLAVTASAGGVAPVTQQWFRSVISGFVPGAGNLIAGATGLTLNDTGLTPGTKYFYVVKFTDNTAATVLAAEFALAQTLPPALDPNSFDLSNILGKVDMMFNSDTFAAQVDVSQATPLRPGQAIKAVGSAGGIVKVVACAANADECIGFINFDVKSQSFSAFDRLEFSSAGNIIQLYATTAIARYAQVTLDLSTVGGVGQLVAASGAKIVGYCLDQPVVGQLCRIKLRTPSYAVA